MGAKLAVRLFPSTVVAMHPGMRQLYRQANLEEICKYTCDFIKITTKKKTRCPNTFSWHFKSEAVLKSVMAAMNFGYFTVCQMSV